MNRGRTSNNLDREIAIRKFLDVSKDSVKRLKALKQAYEKGFENEQEFYEQHYTLIFYVFYDAFISFDIYSKPRQRRSLEITASEKDEFFTTTIYFTFESILFMLPYKIHSRWQYHSIHGIIMDLVHEENPRHIRKRGIKLLVLWILCLQENTTDKVLETFGNLIPFFPPPLTPSPSLRHSSPASEHSDTPTPLQSSPAPSPSDLHRVHSLQGSKRRREWAKQVSPAAIWREKVSSSDEAELSSALELLDYFMNCLVNLVGYHRWEREGYHQRGLHYLFYQFKQHYLSPIFPDAACSKELFPEWVNYHKNDSTFYRLPITSPSNFNLSPTPTPSMDSLNSTSSNLYKITYDLRNSVYAELQNAVIMKVLNWIDPEKLTHNTSAVFHSRDCFINGKESVLRILFTRPENVMLLHDMLHQTFKLPARYSGTMATVVRFFEFWTHPLTEEEALPHFLRSPPPHTEPLLPPDGTDSSEDSHTLFPTPSSVSQRPLLPVDSDSSASNTSGAKLETSVASEIHFASPEGTPTSGASNRTAKLEFSLSGETRGEEEPEVSADLPFTFPPRPHATEGGYTSYDMVWSIAYGAEPWDDRNACIGIQKNLRLFICHTSRLLLLPGERQETDTEHMLASCKNVLKFYQSLGRQCSPDGATWECLLNTLLDVVMHLFSRDNTFSEAGEELKRTLRDQLSESLHSTIFGLFVRMNQLVPVPAALWDRLMDTYSNFTEQRAVLAQWSALMKGLTYLLAYFIYGVDMINRPLKTREESALKKPQSLRKRSGTGSYLSSAPKGDMKPAHSSQALETHGRGDLPLALRGDKPSLGPWSVAAPSQEDARLLVSSLQSTEGDYYDEPLHTVANKGRTHPALDKVRRKRLAASASSSQSSHSPQSSNTSTPQLPHHETRGRSYSKESQENLELSVGANAREVYRYMRPHSFAESHMETENLAGYREMVDRFSVLPGQGGPGGPLKRQGSFGTRSSYRQSLVSLVPHSDIGTDKTNRQKLMESKFIKPIGEELRLQRVSDYKFLLKMLFVPVLNLSCQLVERGEKGALVHHGSLLEENIEQESFIRENSTSFEYFVVWRMESVADVWRRMLCILGNPTHIKTPKHLSIAFSCLAFIWQVLDDVTTIIIYSKRAKSIPYLHYPSSLHFSTWLCQGCLLQEEFKEGVKLSYELLCKTHLSDKFPSPDPLHMEAFCSLLRTGYMHEDVEIVQACVRHSSSLFTRSHSGLTALIPSCTAAVQLLLQKSVKNFAHLEALNLLGNMLSLSRLYPLIGHREGGPTLESQLVELLHYVAQNHPDTSSRILVIYQLTLFLYQSLSCQDKSPDYTSLIKTCFVDLLFFFQSQETPLYHAAVDMVDLLSLLYPQVSQLDPSLPVIVIKCLCLSLVTQLSRSLKREQLTRYMIPLLHCLRSWLLAAPLLHLLYTDPIHLALLTNIISVLSCIMENVSVSEETLSFFKEGVPDMQVSLSRLSSGSGLKSPVRVAPAESYPQDHLNTEIHSVMTTLLYFVGHFPFGPGMSQFCSEQNETMDILVNLSKSDLDMSLFKSPCVQFYTYNDRTILSLVEVRADVTELPCHIQTSHNHVRVIVRDGVGKFSWDVCSMHSVQSHFSKATHFADILSLHSESTDNNSYQDSQESLLSQREPQEEMPPSDVTLTEEPVLAILKELTQSSPELLEDRTSLDMPMPANRILSQTAVEGKMLRAIEQQQCQEQEYLLTNSSHTLQCPVMEEPCDKSETGRHSLFANCLSLLSHMGYFSWENRSKLQLMNKKASLLNDLKALDKMGRSKTNYTCRHQYKVGVIYIGAGQERQKEILKNTSGSKDFNNFVESLGWEVDTKSHMGYGGSMSDSQSRKLTYYADSTMEVVFHISTRILTSSQRGNDVKIQHIGNDDVVVFWSDHWHEYQRSQFRTDFMDIIIVIYPLSNGLYRVQINKRVEHKMLHFGPLHDGALVRQECLAPLVRATAINALRAYRAKLVSFHTVRCNERARKICRMIHEYKKSSTFEDFLAESLVPSGPESMTPISPIHNKSESSYTLLDNEQDDEAVNFQKHEMDPNRLMMKAKDSVTGRPPILEFLQQETKSVANLGNNESSGHKSIQKVKTYPQQRNHHEHKF